MLRNKKGFTLIEVLVVILVATLVIALVCGTLIFITKSTNNFVVQSKEIDTAKNIEKYLRSVENISDIKYSESTDELLCDDVVIFSDTGLTRFEIVNEGEFIKCYMEYSSGSEFEFIIDVQGDKQ